MIKKFLDWLDRITLLQLVGIVFPIIILLSVGIGLSVSFIIDEYNECVQLLDIIVNEEIKD